MARRTERLTVDHLAEVPEPVRSCLFWELSPVSRARLDHEERVQEKQTWLSTVLREWGSCGRVVLVGGEHAGHVLYAPEAWFPGAASLPTHPSTPDAVLLATMWVAPEHRGGGMGRMLVQGMARDLVERGHSAIEAYGDSRGRDGCVLPAEFLGSVGFRTQRAHPVTPRMRMDLRSAISWKDEVELAIDRLWGAVRPAPRRTKATRPIRSARVARREEAPGPRQSVRLR